MYCPQCRSEYRAGVTSCRECGVDLVDELQPEPGYEWTDPVTVLSTSDPAVLAVAQSVLRADGIPIFTQGEMLQDLLGLGRAGGFNVLTGPAKLQVPRKHEARARMLLQEPQALAPPPDADDA